MKTEILFIVLSFLLQAKGFGFAAEEKYRVSDIPEELLEGSKIVVRNENISFVLKSDKNAVMEVTFAITILNENGERHGYFVEGYNKFIRIHNISGRIYDKEGKTVDRLKQDKILDISAIAGFSLFEDSRIKAYRPEYREFPFTVEYSYRIEYRGILSTPVWIPCRDYNAAVEHAKFSIQFPEDNPLRYLEQTAGPCKREMIETDSLLSWEINDLPSIRKEIFSPGLRRISPVVYTAPTDFEISGYDGNAENWKNFGSWAYRLQESRDELNDETNSEIESIVRGVKDEKEKIRLLYEYMQNRTRYANISIGIGGYQPIEAETVDRLGYGDCKGLSNYMMAILKAAGIKSYYTLIKAGRETSPMLRSFPSNQFNHAILCVPLEEDTVWLECTSQHLPAGFLGEFTDDRDALVITENGGVLVHTPKYSAASNSKVRQAVVHMDENGTGTAELVITYRGIQYDKMLPVLLEDQNGQKDYLLKTLKIPSFRLNSFEFKETKYPEPLITGNIKLSIRNYSSRIRDRIILPVNLMNDLEILPERLDERKSDILVRRPEIVTDSIIFYLPEQYQVENHTDSTSLDTDFGNYQCRVIHDGSKLVFLKSFRTNKGFFPGDRYGELLDFYTDVHRADQAKAVLKKSSAD